MFNDNYLYFGGIPDETAILDRPGQLSTVDFVGCIKSISINGNDKNLIKESLNRTGELVVLPANDELGFIWQQVNFRQVLQ